MIIRIQNLRLRTIVGIYDWEKKDKQDVIINVEIEFDGTKAIKTDSIDYSVDYKLITKKVIELVENTNFNLIEKIAADVIRVAMEDEKIQTASVTVDKPGALRFADSVSVTLTKNRKEQ